MKYMRQSRQWSPQSRAKLSASLQGVPKRPQHKAKISQSMKNYWQSVPLKVGTIVEPEQANQPVPPEPRIVTDHGILPRLSNAMSLWTSSVTIFLDWHLTSMAMSRVIGNMSPEFKHETQSVRRI